MSSARPFRKNYAFPKTADRGAKPIVTQVVEISQDGRYLSKHRGFMVVRVGDDEVGRVPLDDITALILSAHQITLSKNLIVELAERKAPIITCGKDYHPVALSLPYESHHDTAGILWTQIECSKPLAKRLWQSVVKEKINNQRLVLEYFNPSSPVLSDLDVLARRVKSGDPENMEAQAARRYWTALLGPDFRRDFQHGLENALLNYGYSVLRAGTARAACGAGLTPALGIHHHNRKNPFALVDDLMEPFRPLVDKSVRNIVDSENRPSGDLTPEIKRQLARVLDEDVALEKGNSTVMNALHRLAQTFVKSLQEKNNVLEFPRFSQAHQLF
ncbi:MAG: type II CRISPR-associated endonuclease Cas1 [Rhodospirillaceae bacterium]|nr:type II CRISPR-associated endonuclease Cas1 [Rhodospirillaceae bacterium]MBT6361965.1 type II CRISPR-associated endonuclease Cas1 [Rhodospirillaceae bacterium]